MNRIAPFQGQGECHGHGRRMAASASGSATVSLFRTAGCVGPTGGWKDGGTVQEVARCAVARGAPVDSPGYMQFA